MSEGCHDIEAGIAGIEAMEKASDSINNPKTDRKVSATEERRMSTEMTDTKRMTNARLVNVRHLMNKFESELRAEYHTDHWTLGDEALNALTAERAALDELEEKNKQLYQDRYDALSVTSKDGLLSSEWILRTGIAERKAKEAEAQLNGLVDGLREIAKQRLFGEMEEDDCSDVEYAYETMIMKTRALLAQVESSDE